jgi:hypothetical protein
MLLKKSKDVKPKSWEEKLETLEPSVYIEGVKVLQKQERIGYFFTLIIALTLVMIMFMMLWIV